MQDQQADNRLYRQYFLRVSRDLAAVSLPLTPLRASVLFINAVTGLAAGLVVRFLGFAYNGA